MDQSSDSRQEQRSLYPVYSHASSIKYSDGSAGLLAAESSFSHARLAPVHIPADPWLCVCDQTRMISASSSHARSSGLFSNNELLHLTRGAREGNSGPSGRPSYGSHAHRVEDGQSSQSLCTAGSREEVGLGLSGHAGDQETRSLGTGSMPDCRT
jgi:hypothetical protein